MTDQLDRRSIRAFWEAALEEDGFERDVTSQIALDQSISATAYVLARESGIFAGTILLDVVREAFGQSCLVEDHVEDGARLTQGSRIATLTGSVYLLLGIERTLLNFLQRLCGVATLTRTYVEAVADTDARIYDTRKTIPGWRQLDKYAVRCGGGRNHRMGLHDAVLIKDNHLAGVGVDRLAAAVFSMLNRLEELRPPPKFVEIEVDTLDQLDAILRVVGVDVVLLDNFNPADMCKAVRLRDELGLKGKVALEASGSVTAASVRAIAAGGVDRIAVGAITHSARGLDIAMDLA